MREMVLQNILSITVLMTGFRQYAAHKEHISKSYQSNEHTVSTVFGFKTTASNKRLPYRVKRKQGVRRA